MTSGNTPPPASVPSSGSTGPEPAPGSGPGFSRTSAVSLGMLLVVLAQASVHYGSSFTKSTLQGFGPGTLTFLRFFLSFVLLFLLFRPKAKTVFQGNTKAIVQYGISIGLLGLCSYYSIRRIPFGVTYGIEMLGPLAIAIFTSRRTRDFVLAILAGVGVYALLQPGSYGEKLDPVGIAFALGGAVVWASYILIGRRLSSQNGLGVAIFGMLVASLCALPSALTELDTIVLSPTLLVGGLGLALLSSAIPYSLELKSLGLLPARTFSILMSTSPAIAALIGLVVLGEVLSAAQWIGLGLIILASIGALQSAATA